MYENSMRRYDDLQKISGPEQVPVGHQEVIKPPTARVFWVYGNNTSPVCWIAEKMKYTMMANQKPQSMTMENWAAWTGGLTAELFHHGSEELTTQYALIVVGFFNIDYKVL